MENLFGFLKLFQTYFRHLQTFYEGQSNLTLSGSFSLGRNVANPTAMLLSAAKLLEHVGLDIHAKKIKLGVDKVLRAGKVRTRDLGGHASTREFARAVVDSI